MGGNVKMSDKCEFCGKVACMSTFGFTCLQCDELPAKQNRIRKLEAALMRIRDHDKIILGEHMDAVRAIARKALE